MRYPFPTRFDQDQDIGEAATIRKPSRGTLEQVNDAQAFDGYNGYIGEIWDNEFARYAMSYAPGSYITCRAANRLARKKNLICPNREAAVKGIVAHLKTCSIFECRAIIKAMEG